MNLLIGANMGRTNVRNWNKLLGIISKDPIGKNITMVISLITPTTKFSQLWLR